MEFSAGYEDIWEPDLEHWVGSNPLSLLSACLARVLSGSEGTCRSYGAMTRARPFRDIDPLVKLPDHIVPSSRPRTAGFRMH